MPVAEQVALIYAVTNGFADSIPTSKMRQFEREYREALRLKHAAHLDDLATSGKMSDEAKAAIESEAKDVAATLS